MNVDPLRSYPVRPFARARWPVSVRPAVETAWQWHESLWQESLTSPPEIFLAAHDAFIAGHPSALIPEEHYRAVESVIQEHNIPRTLFASQLLGASRLAPPVRYKDWPELEEFLRLMIYPQAGILAHLAGVYRTWQQEMVHELAQALFLTGRLIHFRRDIASDRLFFPLADLASSGLSLSDLRDRSLTEAKQKFFWQWSVRARLALSMALPLVHELPRRYRSTFKVWVIGTLEVLREIERRKFDLWSIEPGLSARQWIHIHLQALAGRTTFRTH